jgi:GNAT superfamily N-acetyltransferase
MITITEATINDFDWFIEVFKEFEEFHRKNAKWKFREFSKDVFPFSLYEEILLDSNRIILLARNEDEIVWYILWEIMETISSSIFNDRKCLEVDDLCVIEKYKKQWLWKLLMEHLEKFAKDNNIFELELKVRDFNKWAIGFYEKLGYDIYSHTMKKEI